MSEGSWLTRPNSALIAIDTNVITFVKLDTFSETFETKHCYQKNEPNVRKWLLIVQEW